MKQLERSRDLQGSRPKVGALRSLANQRVKRTDDQPGPEQFPAQDTLSSDIPQLDEIRAVYGSACRSRLKELADLRLDLNGNEALFSLPYVGVRHRISEWIGIDLEQTRKPL